jgi:hypothetical protein
MSEDEVWIASSRFFQKFNAFFVIVSRLDFDVQRALVRRFIPRCSTRLTTLRTLNDVVRATSQFQRANESGRLMRIPTGDGMVLVFSSSPQSPVECTVEMPNRFERAGFPGPGYDTIADWQLVIGYSIEF